MLLTEKNISESLKDKDINEIKTFYLNNFNIEKILLKINIATNIEFLSLQNNLMNSLVFLEQLSNIWYLDVRNNPIENFSSLNKINIFGFLGISLHKTFEKNFSEIKNLSVGILYIKFEEHQNKKTFIQNNPNIFKINDEYNPAFDIRNFEAFNFTNKAINSFFNTNNSTLSSSKNQEKMTPLKNKNFLKHKNENYRFLLKNFDVLHSLKNQVKTFYFSQKDSLAKYNNADEKLKAIYTTQTEGDDNSIYNNLKENMNMFKNYLFEFKKQANIFLIKLNEKFLQLNMNSSEIFNVNYCNFISNPIMKFLNVKNLEQKFFFFDIRILFSKDIELQMILLMAFILLVFDIISKKLMKCILSFFLYKSIRHDIKNNDIFYHVETLCNLSLETQIGLYYYLLENLKFLIKENSIIQKGNICSNKQIDKFFFEKKMHINNIVEILDLKEILFKIKSLQEHKKIKDKSYESINPEDSKNKNKIKDIIIASIRKNFEELFEEIFIIVYKLGSYLEQEDFITFSNIDSEMILGLNYFKETKKLISEEYIHNYHQLKNKNSDDCNQNLKYNKITLDLIRKFENENNNDKNKINDLSIDEEPGSEKLINFFRTDNFFINFQDARKVNFKQNKALKNTFLKNTIKMNNKYENLNMKINQEISTSTSSNLSNINSISEINSKISLLTNDFIKNRYINSNYFYQDNANKSPKEAKNEENVCNNNKCESEDLTAQPIKEKCNNEQRILNYENEGI